MHVFTYNYEHYYVECTTDGPSKEKKVINYPSILNEITRKNLVHVFSERKNIFLEEERG